MTPETWSKMTNMINLRRVDFENDEAGTSDFLSYDGRPVARPIRPRAVHVHGRNALRTWVESWVPHALAIRD